MTESPEELAYVRVGQREWSIARNVIEGLEWWCGSDDQWVSPNSDWWHLRSDCWNVRFPTLAKARAFARLKGWE